MHHIIDRLQLFAIVLERYVEADGAVNVVPASGKVARFEARKLR